MNCGKTVEDPVRNLYNGDMKFFYPAHIRKEADGSYHAVFPDLETCEARGDSLEDVLDRAVDAARDWIAVELEEDEPDLPSATDPADIPLGPDECVRNILINYKFSDGWDE